QGLALATVLAGAMLILMGVLKLSTVIKFIPYPIVVGFTSGIALTLFSTQIKDIFELTTPKLPSGFVEKWMVYFQHLDTVNWSTALIALATVALIKLTTKIVKKI